jgi:hypothetical protein
MKPKLIPGLEFVLIVGLAGWRELSRVELNKPIAISRKSAMLCTRFLPKNQSNK